MARCSQLLGSKNNSATFRATAKSYESLVREQGFPAVVFIDAPVALTLVVGLAGPYTQTVDELPGSDLGFLTSTGRNLPRIHRTMLHGLSSLGVHPNIFGPTSVQFKSEINDAFPRKRHQKRHLEFCTAHLLSRQRFV